jgi:hypothetical protein
MSGGSDLERAYRSHFLPWLAQLHALRTLRLTWPANADDATALARTLGALPALTELDVCRAVTDVTQIASVRQLRILALRVPTLETLVPLGTMPNLEFLAIRGLKNRGGRNWPPAWPALRGISLIDCVLEDEALLGVCVGASHLQTVGIKRCPDLTPPAVACLRQLLLSRRVSRDGVQVSCL